MKKPPRDGRRKAASSPPGKGAFPRAVDDLPPIPADIPVVGIGASAGGLEALEAFLVNLPEAPGVAFVVIQHMDPTHRGALPEILQRSTSLVVLEVEDGVEIEADHVYVIPPDKDLALLHGALRLLEPAAPRGLRLPIDTFFRSLADDREDRAIGVILTGLGSDGTVGLGAIKGRAGVTFVQDPDTARFDGMPRSAVEAGMADVVAPVEDLPGQIVRFLESAPGRMVGSEVPPANILEKALLLLRARTGQDFSLYKRSTLARRIERRMGIHQISSASAYVHLLQEDPGELDLLFKDFLIGVTRFFRDPEAFEQVAQEVMPALIERGAKGQRVRIWVPACATGEEAYSLVILFQEALERSADPRRPELQVFATDLSPEAIATARAGVYPPNIVADVSPERLARFFVPTDRGYRISEALRERVIFAQQNAVMDPPFPRLDLVSCRNLLIYLMPELQMRLLRLLHYSLSPRGFLFLGSSEAPGGRVEMFDELEGPGRLYRRREPTAPAPLGDFAEFSSRAAEARPAGSLRRVVQLESLAERVLLERYSPAAVLADERGDVVFISGRTGRYLEPAAGKVSWNLFAMAREGLRHELADAFHQALKEKAKVTRKGLSVKVNGGFQGVDLTIDPLAEPERLRGLVIVVFEEVAAPVEVPAEAPRESGPEDGERLAALELELRTTKERLQTWQEEVRSANEELQSTNEELRSTNEELTTSKEEMQSMNEELQSLNAEQRSKVEHLSRLNNDMRNLLDSSEIGTVFLDTTLRVRIFTEGQAKIFNLLPTDVGRPITDLASELSYPTLQDDAREVLRTLAVHEEEVAASEGRWFRVRILPYRTFENQIDGVVVTCVEVTAAKDLEAELRSTRDELSKRLDKRERELRAAKKKIANLTRDLEEGESPHREPAT